MTIETIGGMDDGPNVGFGVTCVRCSLFTQETGNESPDEIWQIVSPFSPTTFDESLEIAVRHISAYPNHNVQIRRLDLDAYEIQS